MTYTCRCRTGENCKSLYSVLNLVLILTSQYLLTGHRKKQAQVLVYWTASCPEILVYNIYSTAPQGNSEPLSPGTSHYLKQNSYISEINWFLL